jgi:SAM-dependent methyltransferase
MLPEQLAELDPQDPRPGHWPHAAAPRPPEPALDSAIQRQGPNSSEDFSQNHCPACGYSEYRTLARGTDRLYATTRKSFLLVECAKCELIRLYPWPSPAELAAFYPDHYWFDAGEDTSGQLAERYRRFVLADHVRFVMGAVRAARIDAPVLDVGCGGGLFLRMLQDRGIPVLGLDVAVAAAGVAWRRQGVPAVCASLSRAPFPPATFSVVTMFHVLEHLYDPAAYVDEARRLLKPGGRLIVQVPNIDCWQYFLAGENWNGVDIPRHLIHFKARDVDALLQDCGFEIVRHKHFSWRDNPAGLATTIAPFLDPMSRRIRGVAESPRLRLIKDFLYFLLVIASIPFTMMEAAVCQGSTIMVEARRKP